MAVASAAGIPAALLDAEISFSYASTHAHDVTGRSSAMAKLVSAGMSLADAQKLVGLSV